MLNSSTPGKWASRMLGLSEDIGSPWVRVHAGVVAAPARRTVVPVLPARPEGPSDGRAPAVKVLAFHRALGFVHRSIPAAVDAIEQLGEAHGFDVSGTDDPDRFTHRSLHDHDAVVFVHTSGDVLPMAEQRAGLEGYLAEGGGFFGIHAASSMGSEVEQG